VLNRTEREKEKENRYYGRPYLDLRRVLQSEKGAAVTWKKERPKTKSVVFHVVRFFWGGLGWWGGWGVGVFVGLTDQKPRTGERGESRML